MLGNAFIDSQFNYAPLIWMFFKKGLYLKLQKIKNYKTTNVSGSGIHTTTDRQIDRYFCVDPYFKFNRENNQV